MCNFSRYELLIYVYRETIHKKVLKTCKIRTSVLLKSRVYGAYFKIKNTGRKCVQTEA